MVTELLERSVQEQILIKCGAHFCNNLVDESTLRTKKFKRYEGPYKGDLDGRIYCCEEHYDTSIDQ